MTAWGLVIGAIAGIAWQRIHFRDVAGASRLERLLWMSIGLDVGYVAIGVVLGTTAWTLAKKMSGVGAGTAIIIQGIALLLIDLQFAAVVSR
jgi:sulfite exporter TauE/SafE